MQLLSLPSSLSPSLFLSPSLSLLVNVADGCREDTTIVPSSSITVNSSLTWSEVPIGTVAEVQCVCGIPLPRTATRLCAGNFVSGGRWNQPLDMKCNFTNVVRELCQMPEVQMLLVYQFSVACSMCVVCSSSQNNEVADLTANIDQLGNLGIHLATEIMWQRLRNVTGHPTVCTMETSLRVYTHNCQL